MMKLDTIYLRHSLPKEDSKAYKPRDIPLEFCWYQYFFHQKLAIFVISGNIVKNWMGAFYRYPYP